MSRRDREIEYLDVDCELKHQTDAAYLCIIDGKEEWLPKSQCKFIPSIANKLVGKIQVPDWLAIDRGFT